MTIHAHQDGFSLHAEVHAEVHVKAHDRTRLAARSPRSDCRSLLNASTSTSYAGQSEPVQIFGTGAHNLAWIESGGVMFFADLTGDSSTDGVICLGTQLLAQESSPSPVTGRNWSSLSSPELDAPDVHYVYSGSLDGDSASNLLVVKDGVKFVQEDNVLADFSPHALTTFGSGPLCLSNFGDLNHSRSLQLSVLVPRHRGRNEIQPQ